MRRWIIDAFYKMRYVTFCTIISVWKIQKCSRVLRIWWRIFCANLGSIEIILNASTRDVCIRRRLLVAIVLLVSMVWNRSWHAGWWMTDGRKSWATAWWILGLTFVCLHWRELSAYRALVWCMHGWCAIWTTLITIHTTLRSVLLVTTS